MSNFEDVGEFMTAFGQPVNTTARIIDDRTSDLRYELIREELAELNEAMASDNLIGIADALADLLYVVYGAGHSFGIDLDKCFAEVHRSNMSKLGPDGKPIYREDGKVLKGPGYSPPDLTKILTVR